MPNDPHRTVAAHVQAAIARGLGGAAQPNAPAVRSGGELAAHVQAAISNGQGALAQAKQTYPGARAPAPHVQTAMTTHRGTSVQSKNEPTGPSDALQAAGVLLPMKRKRSDDKRARRKSTRKQTEESRRRSSGFTQPTKRLRRQSATYRNVEVYSTSPDEDPEAAIRQAQKDKKVWNGRRPSWTTGFPQKFWDEKEDKDGCWVCALGYKNCRQRDPEKSHHELEIGHKIGIYGYVMEECDREVVCDGKRHWSCYLYDDVVRANEDMANLEPQCKTCNRHPRQKKKDEPSGEQAPVKLGVCPQKRKKKRPTCTAIKLTAL